MRNTATFLMAGLFALAAAAGLTAQAGAPQTPAPGAQPRQEGITTPQQPTFRVNVDLVTTDVIVRDSKTDQFIADLKAGDFDVFEDGIKQDISSMTLVHGGRAFNVQAPPAAPTQEGIILPPARPTNDAAGRVFLVFIDDQFFEFDQTPRVRDIVKRMLRNLIHEGDMFGIVSTGTSSLSIQMTYDRKVLEDAINRMTGSGLKPADIVQGMQGAQGPSELRHRAHVTFSTALDLMRNLEQVKNRRKAVLWLSSGYDFNPFERARLEFLTKRFGSISGESSGDGSDGGGTTSSDPNVARSEYQRQATTFADADLVRDLADVTRAANRANATLYTIDPRGLVAGPDIADEVLNRPEYQTEWQSYLLRTQDSLRTLAEETGGLAIVNQNDMDKALKRIDAETSDYYVIGYYSSNPDPLRRTRKIEVKTKRDGVTVWSRTSYSLRATTPQR